VEELVGPPFTAALGVLATRYGIYHIRISPYNSRANGVIERKHFDVREALADGDERRWTAVAPSVFWAERVAIQKATGSSPYYLAHDIEPLLPFDLAEGTYTVSPPQDKCSTEEIIAYRARMPQKRPENLKRVQVTLHRARIETSKQFEDKYKNTIRNFDFAPGTFVLVRNSNVDASIGYKTRPRYLGPMVVVRRTR
jgi:hypothetical protein